MPTEIDPDEFAEEWVERLAEANPTFAAAIKDDGDPPSPPSSSIQKLDTWRDRVDMDPRSHKRSYNYRREPHKVIAVCTHQTYVKGGFGVSRRLLQKHDGDALAARMARFIKEPYHGIYSPQDRTSIVQYPAHLVTWASHGANRYSLAWAFDGMFEHDDKPDDALNQHDAYESLMHLIDAGFEQGCDLRYLESHRQHHRMRGRDPGGKLWEVVRACAADTRLILRPNFTTGTGRPVHTSW